MTKSLTDLLAMDTIASRYGCALKPKLRQAIEADIRFPVHAASPQPVDSIDQDNLPENVHSLSGLARKAERKSA